MDDSSKKFEALSPVLELIYILIKNTSKYLDVYAKDIGAEELAEYKKVRDSLASAKKALEEIYGLSEDLLSVEQKPQGDPVSSFQSPVQQSQPVMPVVPSAPLDSSTHSDSDTAVRQSVQSAESTQIGGSVQSGEPVQSTTIASSEPGPATTTTSVDNNQNEIDRILEELRNLRNPNNQTSNNN